MIELIINGEKTGAAEGETVLQAARSSGIHIPTLCYHERLTPPGLCRLCVVEVEGARNLVPACITEVREGMVVNTDSDRVLRARRTILELLDAASDLSDAPDILEEMSAVKAVPGRFGKKLRRFYTPEDDNPFYIRDYSRCILCGRCVQVCSEDIQFSYALTTGGRGFENRITTFFDKKLPETSCVYCGNCISVCPTGALKASEEYYRDEKGAAADGN